MPKQLSPWLIFFSICCLHIMALVILKADWVTVKKVPPLKRLAVQTISLSPIEKPTQASPQDKVPEATHQEKPPEASPQGQKTIIKTPKIQKPESPKPVISKKTKPLPAMKKETPKPVETDLFAKARENMAKITLPQEKRVQPLSVGKEAVVYLEIENLKSIQHGQQEKGYRQELADRLKISLHLPEYGEVKLELTLEHTGKVAEMKIIRAESQVNRKYIEKKLPSLIFSPFPGCFGDAKEYTLSITLCNQ